MVGDFYWPVSRREPGIEGKTRGVAADDLQMQDQGGADFAARFSSEQPYELKKRQKTKMGTFLLR
jgi:hypothetical protein